MAIYNAEISAGSLMLPESRKLARVLLQHPSEEAWVEALKQDNVLQKKTPATARRQARLIRNRLETLDETGWQQVAEGNNEVATQTLLAASIRHSQLLGDFLKDVYAQQLRRLEHSLNAHSWDAFLIECAHRDPAVVTWAESTRKKLFQVIVRMLAEAGYLDSTSKLNLTPPMLHPTVVGYLKRLGDTQTLGCMEQKR